MLLAKPASKRIASSMTQIAANDCSGPRQDTKGYQQKSSGAQRPANGSKLWELPCQGRGRGFESLRPLQNSPCRVETTKNYRIPRRESVPERRFVRVDFTHMNTAQRLRVYAAGNRGTVRRSEGLSEEKTAGPYLL